MSDMVNHPSHYTDGNIEVIDFIEDKRLNYHRGNALKYLCRAGKKDPEKEVEDLQKAVWYINREIQRLEAQKEARAEELRKAGVTFGDLLPTGKPTYSEVRKTRAEVATVSKSDFVFAEAFPRRDVKAPEGVQV